MLWFNSSLGLQLYMILNESETQEDINQNNVYNKCNSSFLMIVIMVCFSGTSIIELQNF